MAVFGGRIITCQNENNFLANSSLEHLDDFMLQVRAYGRFNIKAVQVELNASLLNTNDVFIVCTNKTYYIWCGKGTFSFRLVYHSELHHETTWYY